jgi:hypothetical protein
MREAKLMSEETNKRIGERMDRWVNQDIEFQRQKVARLRERLVKATLELEDMEDDLERRKEKS